MVRVEGLNKAATAKNKYEKAKGEWEIAKNYRQPSLGASLLEFEYLKSFLEYEIVCQVVENLIPELKRYFGTDHKSLGNDSGLSAKLRFIENALLGIIRNSVGRPTVNINIDRDWEKTSPIQLVGPAAKEYLATTNIQDRIEILKNFSDLLQASMQTTEAGEPQVNGAYRLVLLKGETIFIFNLHLEIRVPSTSPNTLRGDIYISFQPAESAVIALNS